VSGKPWTVERKAAFSLAMRKRWRGGVYARRSPARIDTAERAARSARMKTLNMRMRDDGALKRKCVRGQKRVRRSPAYRAVQAAVMTDLMRSPEMRRMARFHCVKINKRPKTRRRQWAGRRRKARTRCATKPASN